MDAETINGQQSSPLRHRGEETIIIKYNAGNIKSVLYALERIGVAAVVTDDYTQIQSAARVIFPGVGEASSAMKYLKERGLDEVIKNLAQPVLGICLGMQLMCRYSEENDTQCLGIFEEEVKKFTPQPGSHVKVPQIGWNAIYNLAQNNLPGQPAIFNNIHDSSYCYFVHGYYAALGGHTIATTNYIQPYSSALHKSNFYGVQFHPEKSAAVGQQLLKNFIELT
jgi:glutamine amidotransferase